jgi:hypothetical protein
MANPPEDMIIDSEGPSSQSVDRARKRGLREREEQDYELVLLHLYQLSAATLTNA